MERMLKEQESVMRDTGRAKTGYTDEHRLSRKELKRGTLKTLHRIGRIKQKAGFGIRGSGG